MLVMLLVYTMIERSVIFQTDDTWNKKSNNDRVMYEYTQYQKYGYLTYVDYTSFLKAKYQPIYGDEYDKQKEFKA
jgi:oligopeptide transport system permease protein